MGVPAKGRADTDVAIETEFLDAGWSTGSKKISYEALIYANEQDKTVYMYEKTTETGHGLSFGGGSESSFQSGTTLFRKVKSIQYGLDGKAYEYTLDLGSIPKTAKETAKKYGWKFKIVLNKDKARYPAGYVAPFIPPVVPPFVPQSAQPSAQPVGQAQTAGPAAQPGGSFCRNCGTPLKENARFCDNCGNPVGTVMQQSNVTPSATPPVMPNAATPAMPQQPPVTQAPPPQPPQYQPQTQPQYQQQPQPQYPPTQPQYQQQPQPQPQYNNPQGAFYSQTKAPASKSKAGTLGLIAFIVLGIIAALIFAIMSVSITGWIIGAAVLVVFGILQRLLVKKGCFFSIVLWVVTAILLFTVLIFTSPSNGSKAIAGNGELTAKLPYEKSFLLNDGKSTGKFKLFVSDGKGRYPDYKDKVICELYVNYDTSSLPKDFKMRDEQATEKDAAGNPALDNLIMVVCSDTEAYHNTSLSYGAYIYNNGSIRPFLETEGGTADVDAATIKEIAKYPKMQVLWYNPNEVGMTKQGDGWSTNTDKAFGLHPPITEGNIPWEEILSDLGIK